jgi:hypothetical protein
MQVQKRKAKPFYRTWRIGIARDYSIASLAANAWNFNTTFQRFKVLESQGLNQYLALAEP